jgi:predicted methyltransferase
MRTRLWFRLLLACCSLSFLPLSAGADFESRERLMDVLKAQPDEVKARYAYRRPDLTLQFFGIEPGMTVVEALPGGGWYTRILLPYLGPEGRLIGADYAVDMFPLFGFFSPEAIEAKKSWVETWTKEAGDYLEDGAAVSAFQFGSLPDAMDGSADAVLLIRALHNLARFEDQGGFLTAALADAYRVLKPGGLAGVVQHEAAEDKPDAFADGSRGYLKKSFVIAQMEKAGFELVADSPINENDRDRPGPDDVVWRLPPTLAGTRDDPVMRAEVERIGESNRMTLLFRKPE